MYEKSWGKVRQIIAGYGEKNKLRVFDEWMELFE